MPVSTYIQQTQLESARKVQIGKLFNACEMGDYDEVVKIIEDNEKAGDEWNAGSIHNGV